eukprot:JZ553382.1.p1 GENE.JZ553382.1~~JZ553382.1.p1  ORF type:complete len:228 (+),score=37.04 JZ553382.1:25-684(+)
MADDGEKEIALQEDRVIVVLEKCCLEVLKTKKGSVLLNADDHATYLARHGRDPSEARPDITHQCLLTLMDSPLNKAGRLQVYLHTRDGVLIEVNHKTRIPRTFKRFAGLMVQLLEKLSIRAVNGNEKLLKVIKNPVTKYFPPDCPKYGTSCTASRLIRVKEFAATQPKGPIVFVIGALAHGKAEVDYTQEALSFSNYPLSGSVACGKLCQGFEEHWGII